MGSGGSFWSPRSDQTLETTPRRSCGATCASRTGRPWESPRTPYAGSWWPLGASQTLRTTNSGQTTLTRRPLRSGRTPRTTDLYDLDMLLATLGWDRYDAGRILVLDDRLQGMDDMLLMGDLVVEVEEA